MKIPLKYGLIAAVGLIIWILGAHWLVPNPQSKVHALGAPIFFNVLHFAVIFLGLKALEREQGAKPRFKDALKTGVAIAFVYALTASLFFVAVVMAVGTRWMSSGPGANTTPTRMLLAQAFAGLFLGTMIFGLIYSTVIAFFVARRQSEVRD
jgi:predicted permease